MRLSLVAAASENNVIGRKNALPWKLPNDMKFFREVTRGKPVIMGRKTHESIGRPLPERHNIVVTRQAGLAFPGCDVAASLDEAVRLAEKDEPEEACVIGGGELYRQAMPVADRIYLTRVHAAVEGDVTFPDIADFEWREASRERHEADETHEHPYSFIVYERRR